MKINSMVLFIALIIRQIERDEINNVLVETRVGNRLADRVQILSSNRARYTRHDTVDDSTAPVDIHFRAKKRTIQRILFD